MPDRAAAIADFLCSPEARRIRDPGALRLACARHCPGITAEEIARGIQIAVEIARADAAEHHAEADALDAVATEQRRQGPA